MPTRRQLLQATAATTGLATMPTTIRAAEASDPQAFRYCLNTSTIRGQKLDADAEVDVAGKAGYDGIEPWMRKLAEYTKAGGKLADLRKQIEDYGMMVESAIGFAKWIVDDNAVRAEALEEAKRDMDIIAQLGGTRIAAPPAGATKEPGLDLDAAAERYHALLEVGREMGVTPQIEVWGFSANLHTLEDSMYVALASAHPDACLLADVYHLYKGGGSHQGLRMLGPNALRCFHMNDYPADPPRESISDADRVYPGDGVAPVTEILQGFAAAGARPTLSLELFNKSLWEQDPNEVAATGLAKMKAAVAKAGL